MQRQAFMQPCMEHAHTHAVCCGLPCLAQQPGQRPGHLGVELITPGRTHALVVAPSTTGFSYSSRTLCVVTGRSAKRRMISSRPRSWVMLFS